MIYFCPSYLTKGAPPLPPALSQLQSPLLQMEVTLVARFPWVDMLWHHICHGFGQSTNVRLCCFAYTGCMQLHRQNSTYACCWPPRFKVAHLPTGGEMISMKCIRTLEIVMHSSSNTYKCNDFSLRLRCVIVGTSDDLSFFFPLDFCLPKGETGVCRAAFKRWWYDAESETCINFTYGGCPVNLNNHPGEEECMAKCSGVKGEEDVGSIYVPVM